MVSIEKASPLMGPLVETIERAVVLDDRYLDRLVGRAWHTIRPAKLGVIPAEWFRLDPLRLVFLLGVFDDYAHPLPPVVIRQITHHPHAGMPHFDQC